MKHKPSSMHKLFWKDGKFQRPRACPRCGEGVYLASHKDRYTCGRCFYSELRKTKAT